MIVDHLLSSKHLQQYILNNSGHKIQEETKKRDTGITSTIKDLSLIKLQKR
jgi:hypothetical protein